MVERALVAGLLACPGCAGVLGGWGFARRRVLRCRAGDVVLCPRRARCRACAGTLCAARGYSLPLNVFTVDSPEDAGVHPRQAQLQQQIPEDIRIRHTEEEIARYQRLRTRRFDVVVGNPPWGGVLKGRLSPLNDPDKRRDYAAGVRVQGVVG